MFTLWGIIITAALTLFVIGLWLVLRDTPAPPPGRHRRPPPDPHDLPLLDNNEAPPEDRDLPA